MPTSEELPRKQTDPEAQSATLLAPLYQIILFDDDEHTYQYVVEMLTTLFGMTAEEAFRIAYEVDYIGQAVVVTCPLEDAIRGRDAILHYGPDPLLERSHTSMKAIILEASE